MSEFRNPVPGAAVVCLHAGCVLLVRRATEPNRGRWSFPGGKVEPGETARACAAREAREEAGIQVQVLDPVDVYDALFPPYHYVVADYLAVPAAGAELRPGSDVLDARWVPLAAVGDYDITDAMHTVLARARSLIEGPRGAPALGKAGEAPPRDRVRGLYVVTDSAAGHLEMARAAIEGGAGLVQLRDKRADAGDLLAVAREMAALCRRHQALLIVNDRVDLAFACGAHGVHLGQTDLPIRVARALLGPAALIGVSVEDAAQVRRATDEGADYLGVGPIYGTLTKADAGDAVGPRQIRAFRTQTSLPLVAIGGIGLGQLSEVRAAGADGAAVIGAVALAADPAAAVRALTAEWGPL